MSTHYEGRSPCQDATQKTTSATDFTPDSNLVKGWYALGANAKASRDRRLKKSWKRESKGSAK